MDYQWLLRQLLFLAGTHDKGMCIRKWFVYFPKKCSKVSTIGYIICDKIFPIQIFVHRYCIYIYDLDVNRKFHCGQVSVVCNVLH